MSDPQEKAYDHDALVRHLIAKKASVVEKLEKLADELYAKQRYINIAKISFASSGLAGSGLTIAGILAARFAVRGPVPLSVAGVTVGVACGLGELVTYIIEGIAICKAMEEANRAVGEYMKMMDSLKSRTDKQVTEMVQKGLAAAAEKRQMVTNILKGFIRTGKTVSKFGKTVKVVNKGADAVIDVASSSERGLLTKLGLGVKAAKFGGAVLLLLTIPFDVATILRNYKQIHSKESSKVVKQIRAIATALKESEHLF